MTTPEYNLDREREIREAPMSFAAVVEGEHVTLAPVSHSRLAYMDRIAAEREAERVERAARNAARPVSLTNPLGDYRRTMSQPEQTCGHCGNPATVEIRVNHTSQDGKWMPVCSEYAHEQYANADDHNQHEMANFGGRYGLVSVETRQLKVEPDRRRQMAQVHVDRAAR